MAVSHSVARVSGGILSRRYRGRIFNRMKLSIAASIVLLAVIVPNAAQAQVDSQYSWGLTAGGIVPAGELGDDHTGGANVGITFAFGGVGQLIGVRVDGMINQFWAKSGTAAGDARILGGTVNFVTGLLGRGDRVYAIAGVGGYTIRPDIAGQKNVNDFGLNGGVGLFLPSISGFIEARYHHFYRAFPDKRPAVFVPITLGILF